MVLSVVTFDPTYAGKTCVNGPTGVETLDSAVITCPAGGGIGIFDTMEEVTTIRFRDGDLDAEARMLAVPLTPG